MQGISGIALMFFQDSGIEQAHDVHLVMICLVIITAIFVLLILGAIAGGIYAARLVAKIEGLVNQAEKRALPTIDKVNVLMQDLTPKVQALSSNVEHISATVKAKIDEVGVTVSQINETVQEINGRTRIQVARADGIVTNTLTATKEISESVQHSIRVPVRQIAGIVAGVKAGLETLVERSPFGGGRTVSGSIHETSRPSSVVRSNDTEI